MISVQLLEDESIQTKPQRKSGGMTEEEVERDDNVLR